VVPPDLTSIHPATTRRFRDPRFGSEQHSILVDHRSVTVTFFGRNEITVPDQDAARKDPRRLIVIGDA
jgi:hypothetical protein